MYPKIIAEVGCNHKGSIDIAEEMIKTASKYCNVDVVKFQKRTVKELYTKEEFDSPHPVPRNSYGQSYGEHREFLEFNLEEHKYLKALCEESNIEYSTSVWDLTAAKQIIGLNPKIIKVPSACNNNAKMLSYLAENFNGEIHISLGMTKRSEERSLVKIMEKHNRLKDLVLYSCTSGYPVDFNDVCILEINRLRDHWGNSCKAIGFSGHHLGIAVDMGAITLGASYIERHFTLDRTWKGTDHAASLEPDGMRKLVRDSKAMFNSLTYKREEILEVEKFQRKKLKRLRYEK